MAFILLGLLTCCIVSTHVPVKDTTKYFITDVLFTKVSIHVPVKDTTSSGNWVLMEPGSFNPRTRKGYDGVMVLVEVDLEEFQSTYP